MSSVSHERVCSKCKVPRPIDRFSIKRTGRYASWCKDCANQAKKQRYHANIEKARDKSRQQNQRHRQRSQEYRDAHRAERQAYNREWRQKNPEKALAAVHRRRARRLANGGSYTVKEWRELKAIYEHHCLACGRAEPDIQLVIDHVVPLSRGGSNDISNLQPLCVQCNTAKAAEIVDYRDGRYDPRLTVWRDNTAYQLWLAERIATRKEPYRHPPEEIARMTQRSSKVYSGFIAPNGTLYSPVSNIVAFAAAHGLSQSQMYRLAWGKTQQHRGWTRVESDGEVQERDGWTRIEEDPSD